MKICLNLDGTLGGLRLQIAVHTDGDLLSPLTLGPLGDYQTCPDPRLLNILEPDNIVSLDISYSTFDGVN